VPSSAAAGPLTEGAVLVRLPARDRTWPRSLPPVPEGRTLTVTVGHAGLLPRHVDALTGAGYRLVGVASERSPVGVASERSPVGATIDVLVPRDLREDHHVWWRSFARDALRIFDLRMGPVRAVLAADLELHLRALEDR
jgi:hypothetical protein